ncbi:MAG: hypothetical protein ACI9TI_000753, partial [Natronomonas sp.]
HNKINSVIKQYRRRDKRFGYVGLMPVIQSALGTAISFKTGIGRTTG